jgi:hypothetical protein
MKTTFRQESRFWLPYIVLYISLLAVLLSNISGCQLAQSIGGMKEAPQSLLEQVAVAEASAQWMVQTLNDVAKATEADVQAGVLEKGNAAARVRAIKGFLCDLGLSDGSLPPGCPATTRPSARALIASAGTIALVDPKNAEQKLVQANLTITTVRGFLRPYLKG